MRRVGCTYCQAQRHCQGKLNPLDGVGLHNCPKPILRLATQCCDRHPPSRPLLASLAAELQGPVLALLESNQLLEARGALALRHAPRPRTA